MMSRLSVFCLIIVLLVVARPGTGLSSLSPLHRDSVARTPAAVTAMEAAEDDFTGGVDLGHAHAF